MGIKLQYDSTFFRESWFTNSTDYLYKVFVCLVNQIKYLMF